MADAGKPVQPERIGRCRRDEGRAVDAGDIRPLASPRIARALEAAARGFFPLRFGREAMRRAVRRRQPFAIAHRLEPVDPHHGLMRIGKARIAPPRRGRCGRRREEARVLLIGDGTPPDLESVDPDAMSGTLARVSLAPSHPEPARGDFHELHGVEYNRRHHELRRAHVASGDRIRVRGAGPRQGPGAAGTRDHPPRDRRARLRHAPAHPRGRQAGPRRRRHALWSRGGPARAEGSHRQGHGGDAQHSRLARRDRGDAGGQAHHVLRHHRPRESGRRGDLSESWLPHLRVGDQLRGRQPRAHPAARGERLRLRHGGLRERGVDQDQAHHHQLAAESHGRRARSRPARSHRGDGRPLQDSRAHRRDLQGLPVRGRVRLHHALPRHARSHHRPGRLLEVLRHDGLAHGLRRHAHSPRRARDAAHGQLELLHGFLHAVGGHRRAAGRPDAGAPDGRRVQASAPSHRGGAQRLARSELPHAQGRLLRVPQHQGAGQAVRSGGGSHSQGRRRRRAERHRLRSIRRGISPAFLCQLRGEHHEGPRLDASRPRSSRQLAPRGVRRRGCHPDPTGVLMPTVADVLVDGLRRAGVSRIFGVPGGSSNLEVLEAARAAELPFVLCHQESSACIMAAVTGELTGAPGAVLSTLGPGVSASATGLAHAFLDRSPLIYLSDRHPQAALDYATHQAFAHAAMLAPLVKGSLVVTPDSASHWIAHSVQLALAEPRGPVHLDLPADVAAQPAVPLASSVTPAAAPLPSPADLDGAAEMIRRAKRPVVLVGLQCRAGDAKWLRAFAEALPAPVLSTYKAKGALPDPHPLALGVFTSGALEEPAVGRADLIVAFGLDTVELIPRRWSYTAPVLSLARAPSSGRGGYFVPALELVGDLSLVLEELAPRLRNHHADWDVVEVDRLRRDRQRALEVAVPGLAPHRIVQLAREYTPSGTIATVDAGAHMFPAAEYWQAVSPGEFLISNGLATMGFALPAAIAAQLVCPEQRVLCFTGDGGFMMVAAELETMVRLRLPITVIVFNDAALSLIEVKQEQRGYTGASMRYAGPDLAALAGSFGVAARTVTDEAGFTAALVAAQGASGPTLIDARIDPSGYRAMLEIVRAKPRA